MGGKSAVKASDDERRALVELNGSRDWAEADRAWTILLRLSGWTSGRGSPQLRRSRKSLEARTPPT
jgi:hypothetical protein